MASEKMSAPVVIPPKTSPEAAAAPTPADPPEWLEVGGLGTPQAEQLLDWLEINGFEQRQIVVAPDNSFVVRYLPRSLRGPL